MTELTTLFTNIANAIREKSHMTAKIQANDFPNEIKKIKTGFNVDEINSLMAENNVILVDNNNKQYKFSTEGVYNNTLSISEKKLITFTITHSETCTFQAEEGMTWREWINSPYNTWSETSLSHWYTIDDSIYIDDGLIYVDPAGRGSLYVYINSDWLTPDPDDIIDPTMDWQVAAL